MAVADALELELDEEPRGAEHDEGHGFLFDEDAVELKDAASLERLEPIDGYAGVPGSAAFSAGRAGGRGVAQRKRRGYDRSQRLEAMRAQTRQCASVALAGCGLLCVLVAVIVLAVALGQRKTEASTGELKTLAPQRPTAHPSSPAGAAGPGPGPAPSIPGTTHRLVMSGPLRTATVGENNVWYGPFTFGAPALINAFLPIANMSFVHHLVVYKAGADDSAPGYKGFGELPRAVFSDDSVVFAWARTGQSSPWSFSYDRGTGVFVGPHSDAESLFFNIHYEVPAAVARESAEGRASIQVGLDLTLTPLGEEAAATIARCARAAAGAAAGADCARAPVGITVEILANSGFELPADTADVDVTHTCRLRRDVTLFAYRNHGHEAGRLWVTELVRDGVALGAVVNRTVQDPQVFWKMPFGGVQLLAGDLLTLHCHYDTRGRSYMTGVGGDLSKGEEMCNFYAAFYPLRLDGDRGMCDEASRPTPKVHRPDAAWPSLRDPSLPAWTAAGMGQVASAAVSPDGSVVYVAARRGNDYFSSQVLAKPAIFALDAATGRKLRELGAGLFVAPHGLQVDASGRFLWATDSSQSLIFKLDAQTGAVLLRLGEAFQEADDERHFGRPTDVAVDPERDEVYVSDGYANTRVAVLNATSGQLLRRWGQGPGSGRTELNIPHGVAFDSRRRRVLVADRENCRVNVYSPTGELEDQWSGSAHCKDPVADAQLQAKQPWLFHLGAVAYSRRLDIVLTVEGDQVVKRRPDTGAVVSSYGAPGELLWPHDVDIAADAVEPAFYVAQLYGFSLTKFTAQQA
jgi:DNA-binding beta-propeller fold protein YncE